MKFYLALLASAGAAVWLVWPGSASEPAPAAAPSAVSVRPRMPAAVQAAPRITPIAPANAARSMADMRLHGDPESPPIALATETGERPTEQELADPSAYAAFESRQTAQLYAAYVRAVDQELPRLRQDIERARSMGIDAGEIAKAEAKARGLEEMRRQLVAQQVQQKVHQTVQQ
jgi:arylsulfatase A-like enzyme